MGQRRGASLQAVRLQARDPLAVFHEAIGGGILRTVGSVDGERNVVRDRTRRAACGYW